MGGGMANVLSHRWHRFHRRKQTDEELPQKNAENTKLKEKMMAEITGLLP
jgi:hypothetical protein